MNVHEAWKDYVSQVVPDDAGKAQVRETKKAFYAGASIMLVLLARLPDDEDAAIAEIAALDQECSEVMTSYLARQH